MSYHQIGLRYFDDVLIEQLQMNSSGSVFHAEYERNRIGAIGRFLEGLRLDSSEVTIFQGYEVLLVFCFFLSKSDSAEPGKMNHLIQFEVLCLAEHSAGVSPVCSVFGLPRPYFIFMNYLSYMRLQTPN